MYNVLKVGSKYIEIKALETGQTVTVPAYGNILAAAVQRTSRSRYKAFIIWNNGAEDLPFSSLKEAVSFLQKCYNGKAG